ncbi:MAG: Ig-like domain-containing protein, partial [Pseudomonadota bacterium]
MTNFNSFQEFEFTAFSGSDLLQQGDTQLSCGDSFTMPFSATACITVTDNDRALSGDARRNEEGDDRSGQIADIELNGVEVADGVKIYAERFTVVRDEDGNTYKLIEIEIAGSPSDDNNDFFTFFGDVPPAGAQLTVVSTGNVAGNWLGYKHLSAGLKWDLDDDGKLTIEAEDMALKGYRVDDIDAASGGEVIKLKKKEGEAEITFGAQDGVYDLELAYVDENDGQGSIVVEVNGVVVQTIILDQDNNGNGNDHSTISTIKIDNLNLSQGDTITLRGERDQYEFARIDALTFCLNKAPDAVDDDFSIGESDVLIDDILGNDSDPDGDTIEIISADGNPTGVAFTVTSADGREAAVIVAPSGALNIAADTIGNFEDLALGETDTITLTYTISDGNGATDTADVTITINGENDGPVAVDDSFSIGESDLLVEDILGNDSDVDASDELTITEAESEPVGTLLTVTSTGNREAAVIVAPSGALNLAVDTIGNFEDLAVGETDTLTVTYTITDGNGGTDTATATITINGENDGPVAVDDSFTIGESEVLVDDILGNDSDVDASDELEVIEAEGQPVGTLINLTSAGGRSAAGIVAPSGALNLAVDTISNFEDLAVGETDTLTITYTITDGNGGTDTATATITINGENDGPVAVDDSFAIGESEVLVDDILGNDSDVDASDVVEIISAEGEAVGTLLTLTSAGGREAAGIVAASGDLNLAVDTIDNF